MAALWLRNSERVTLVALFSLLCQPSSFAAPSSSPVVCDTSTHFDCGQGACIPLEWRCDNLDDCPNGLDERNCNYLHECRAGAMICRNGECVSSSYRCDGNDDCGDGTDERACPKEGPPRALGPALKDRPTSSTSSTPLLEDKDTLCTKMGLFSCRKGPCIPRNLVCDSMKDCPGGDDEENCGRKATEGRDTCQQEDFIPCADNSTCIPASWSCDGKPDCPDGSDEATCLPEMDAFFEALHPPLCPVGSFRCHSGECIAAEKACDNEGDCLDGSDEGHYCGECAEYGCAYKCIDSPRGAKCVCPEGSHLEMDGVSCSEVDECQSPAGKRCSQLCENSIGGYTCVCEAGYQLDVDHQSCRLAAEVAKEGSLFMSVGTEVRVMPLFDAAHSGNAYSTYQRVGVVGTTRSLSFNRRNNHLYMAIANGDNTGRLAVAARGLQRPFIDNLQGVSHVAVDWLGNNVFFTLKHPSPRPGIMVCRGDGRFCRQIVDGELETSGNGDRMRRQIYKGLALDPLRGLMFWIDAFDGQEKIMMARMNGEKKMVLVDEKVELLSGLAVDHIRGDVYFGDYGRTLIERVNVDSQEREVLAANGVHNPAEIAFFNGHVFWTDLATSSLKVIDLKERRMEPRILHSVKGFPHGLAINHSLYQAMPISNPCEKANCPFICVVVPSDALNAELAARCLCPEHYITKEDGSCAPNPELPKDTKVTRLSSVLMKEFCSNNIGCLNDGECDEVRDSEGRIENILCRCRPGFAGDFCEYSLGQEPAEGESSWLLTLLLFVLLLAVLLGLFYLALLSESTERLLLRIPMPAAWSLRQSLRRATQLSTPVKPSASKSSVFSRDNFSNPAFVPSEVAEDSESRPSTAGPSPAFEPHCTPGSNIC